MPVPVRQLVHQKSLRRCAFCGSQLHSSDSKNVQLILQVQVLAHSLAFKCISGAEITGGDGRINSPHQYSISRQFAPLPPFFPRRLGCRRHPCAFSPEGSRALRAVRCTRVHVRAWHVVGQPPR
jgi:hypothetical protein